MDPSFFSISYAEPFITASISWLEPPGPCFPFSHDTNSLALHPDVIGKKTNRDIFVYRQTGQPQPPRLSRPL